MLCREFPFIRCKNCWWRFSKGCSILGGYTVYTASKFIVPDTSKSFFPNPCWAEIMAQNFRCLEGMIPLNPTNILPKSACNLSNFTRYKNSKFQTLHPPICSNNIAKGHAIFCRQTCVDSSAVWKTWGCKLLLLWICYLPTRRSPKECVSWQLQNGKGVPQIILED